MNLKISASIVAMGLFTTSAPTLFAQESTAQNQEKFLPSFYENAKSIAEADSIFNAFFKGKKFKKGDMHKHYNAWRQSALDRADAQGRLGQEVDYAQNSRDVLAPPPAFSITPNWTAIGPFSWDVATNNGWNPGVGRLNSVTEDPKNSNVIYVCSPSGGAFRSADGGNTWVNITDFKGIAGCSDIVVDHQNSSVLYMLTGDRDGSTTGSGIWKSTDLGVTWTKTAHAFSSFKGYHLRMHPTNNQILVSSSNQGVFVTKDAGSTWTSIGTTADAEDIEFLPANPNIVFLSKTNSLKAYDLSTMTSTSITGLSGIGRAQIAVSAAAPNRVYIAGAGSSGTVGIWWYDYSTKTLTQKMGASAGNLVNMQGYWYSTSDAASLTDAGQYTYDLAFAVSPTNANRVYHGAINEWVSNDGGVNWTQGCKWSNWSSCPNYTHADIHGIYTFGNNVYTVSDGGIFKSTDNMANTKNITTGLNITMFYNFGHSVLDRDIMLGGTQDNGVYFKKNGIWTTEIGADAYGGFVDVTNTSIMYYAYGATKRSTSAFNNGQSGVVDVNSTEIKTMDQATSDVNKMIGTGPSGLFYSSDRGLTWTAVQTGNWVKAFYVQSKATVAWAVNSSGQVYRSTNSGLSWSLASTGLVTGSTAGIAVDPNNELIAWVAYTGTRADKVYKTVDGGATWTNYTGTGIGESIKAIASGGQNLGDVYIGTTSSLYYRDNSLSSWVNWSAGLPLVQVQHLYTHALDKKLRAVTYGRGIWEADLYKAPTSSSVNTSSSAGLSSSQGLSSSSKNLSSSQIQSSSSAIVSSSIQTSSSSGIVKCSDYNVWNGSSYNWVAQKEYVSWKSKVWSHQNWVGGEPGVDAEWLFEKNCESVVNTMNKNPLKYMYDISLGIIRVEGASEVQLSNSKGEIYVNLVSHPHIKYHQVELQTLSVGQYWIRSRVGNIWESKAIMVK